MTKEKANLSISLNLPYDKNSKELDLTLISLKLGETAIVAELNTCSDVKRRFLDLGIVGGTKIKALYKSPFGDPIAYLVRGTVIALRSEDSRNIFIRRF